MSEWIASLERWLGSRGELQAAVEFTAAKTGFQPALVEKDFWCSVVLGRLYAAEDCPLVFKGGTLLSKAMDWLAEDRLEIFRRQIEGELRPVLRPETFASFDVDRAFALLRRLAAAVRSHGQTL